jgi:hypothetical protein
VKKTFGFSLAVHPRGEMRKDESELNEDNIAVYLNNNSKEKLTLRAEISAGTYASTFTHAIRPGGGYGYGSFVKRSELEADKDSLLPGGSLEIICKFCIFYPKKVLHASESASVSLFF